MLAKMDKSAAWCWFAACYVCYSTKKVRLDTALELSLYLSKETEIMAVTQGFGELVPLYKLMEKRDMAALENQMKVSEGSIHGTSQNIFHVCQEIHKQSRLPVCLKSWNCLNS